MSEKIACITLDFEMDYGSRIGECNILKSNQKEIQALAGLFARLEVPVSAFIETDLLERYPGSMENVRVLASDFHCHSHTHSSETGQIVLSAKIFRKYFDRRALGYRAPLGLLRENDARTIRENGFEFSSSVFPIFRPGKFNNLAMPTRPFVYGNGLVELPFAVVPKLHYVIALSYLKIIGFKMNEILFSAFGLPKILIFNTHLHDFIVNEKSFAKLPLNLRLAWGVNKYRGPEYFIKFISLLRERGYNFMTMTELYESLRRKVKNRYA